MTPWRQAPGGNPSWPSSSSPPHAGCLKGCGPAPSQHMHLREDGAAANTAHFRIPLPPRVRAALKCHASAGAALPAANPARYSPGASPPAAGDRQHACPQTRLLQAAVGGHTEAGGHPPAAPPSASWSGACKAERGRAGSRVYCCSPVLQHHTHGTSVCIHVQSFRPQHSNSEHSTNRKIIRHVRRVLACAAAASRGSAPQGAAKQREETPGGTRPQRA